MAKNNLLKHYSKEEKEKREKEKKARIIQRNIVKIGKGKPAITLISRKTITIKPKRKS